MSDYIVSARKYRPETFSTVVGQQALTRTLKAAIDSNRLAHAYLFCGPRGVGKTSCARIFAKSINCLSPTADGEACNHCESCKAFNEQRSYNIAELDAASNNSVDDIRNLIEQVQIPPQIGKYRVFIIDEVHMLSTAAFNAFLKTLEEPPAHAIFILATTEKQKIIPTILSRCQIYDFARITINDMVAQLQYVAEKEGIKAEPAALNVIAQKADGAMRDALSIFDQVAASSMGNITYQSTINNLNVLDHEYYFRLMDAFRATDVPQALLIYKEIRDKGFDSQFFINGLANHMRNMMVALTPATKPLLEMSDEVAARFVEQARLYHPKFYYRALDLCNTCDLNYRNATNKQFLVELTLVKLCQILDPTPPMGVVPQQKLKKVEPTTQSQPAQNKSQTATSAAQSTQQIQSSPVQPASSPASSQAPAQASTQAYSQTPASVQAPTPASAPSQVQSSVRSTASAPIQPATPAQPQVATRTQPAQQPASNPAARSANSPRTGYSAARSFSINDVTTQSQTQTPKSPGANSSQRNAFTEKQLTDAWEHFIATHPNEKVIVNTMRKSTPKRVDDTLYEISVESQGQVEFFNTHRSEIVSFLRKEVGNDMLAIDVKVRQGGDEHKLLSPREVIEDMTRQNPAVTGFINAFRLGLA